MTHLMNVYARQSVTFTHGEGARVYDEQGRSYLDALAGIAVNTLGHGHPRLSKALAEQAGRLIHTSNLYRVREQELLADRLAVHSGMAETFFCNSGCEANEAAIKLARLYGHNKGIEQPAIIVMEKAFHGRTLATLSATGNRKVQAGFEPLVGGFIRVPYDDLAALEAVARNNANVVAVLLEPIQGEGGIRQAHQEYLQALRRICTANDWLLMLDEVQCGLGRTGRWFAHQHAGILPDVMTLAKGLGSGVPIGACLAAGKAAGVFGPGNHGSTFGGNPLACIAALTTLEVIEQDGLLARAQVLGATIRDGLASALAGLAGVVDIRGSGLMIGIELDRNCGELVQQALVAGLLINVTADKVVRLLPPLIFSDAEAAELVGTLSRLIREFLAAGD
ncbi:Acetylornithine aminotransferase [Sterolibacterium denitrificans]|uniref:Acetylornithine aminotransferase n=1 Tax=Sterolibacterium denitrificans TaxID=157592 RepID=A0A7Z7MWM6_9PROT|nr:aspartate aminotransferase family protein [Sterolibacterium denitrificans]SMB31415.1 Acetylornithine aminotransferase [Sterolibacterium denitrificans]